ncbi:hypothetical protein BDZ85DRAFT_291369 [Elsinoe ampelina]|uniref:PH domain-containing protein n=1 Tax=Elsinoe ampelina TaxID=302913 RepID=A0A6A6G370_9PEZI|nr:hypothetical protein BDZ85DRAFT_291369 [Elsinoe ampelina]
MSSSSRSPNAPIHNSSSYPNPDQTQINRGYGAQMTPTTSTDAQDYGADTRPTTAQSYDSNKVNSSYAMENSGGLSRSASRASTTAGDGVSRSNTLKKRNSLSRRSSLKRSGSRKSLRAGSIKGVVVGEEEQDKDYNSAFHTPIPTHGSPTDVLANRFQAWRSFLKGLITYFREIQTSYEARSKAIMKVSNTISNTQAPSVFMSDGGLNDASRILGDYHKHALSEANKAKDIEQDVIQALNGLRADLGAKIKEIKSLHGDFKNSVEKEKEGTRKAIAALDEALQHYDHHDGQDKGRNDPFIVRLNVDRFVERQIDEENYLHRAYLNLESSGRELESIVVGEIQKAYNAYAGILKREADDAYNTVDLLRTGPVAMQKDFEWNHFVNSDPHLVNPEMPLRNVQDIEYPGKYHPAAAEIRAGMLERKSKYLKSYTAGWYVLSPTHLHEFKSADNIYSQPPVMSLYLGEQKLGSHSQLGSSSHKFMLKGKQAGSMHRGHSWVFRAESHETMLAWFEAIKNLTERTGADKAEYVRKHSRSVSGNSARAMSISSDGMMDEDEADQVPYAASINSTQLNDPPQQQRPQRPQPGGRFPSDLALPRRDLALSDYSSDPEQDTVQSHNIGSHLQERTPKTPQQDPTSYDGYDANPYTLRGVATHESSPAQQRERVASDAPLPVPTQSHQNNYASAHDGQREQYPEPTVSQPSESHPANSVPTQTFVLPLRSEAPTHQLPPQELEPPKRLSTEDRHNSSYALESPESQQVASRPLHSHNSAPFGTGVSNKTIDHKPKQPMTRQNTDYSVSALHVPGEFPKSTDKGAKA